MKIFTAIKILVLFLLLTTNVFAALDLPGDTILAVVNKEVITLKDLHEYIKNVYLQLMSEGRPEAEVKGMMKTYEEEGLGRLIDDKLLLDEANRIGMTIREKAIADRLEQIKSGYPDEASFLKSFTAEGLTVNDIKKKITDQLKLRYFLEMEIKDKIFVSPGEVTEYYQQHIDEFQKPERVDLDSIFISFVGDAPATGNTNPDNKKTAEEKANQASRLLKSGQNFADVAKKFSQLPSVGIVGRGQMLPLIENATFNLKENEISEPIKTDTGIFIFKLKGKHAPEAITFDEIKNKIHSLILNQKFQKKLSAKLEELRKKAYVEIKN